MECASSLLILRHAEAAWARPGQKDYDRPLNDQGRNDALALGHRLASMAIVVDIVISSGAARARETLGGLTATGLRAETVYDDALYHGGEEAYRAAANRYPNDRVLLIGHNPALGEFARAMSQDGEPWAVSRVRAGFPTCALAILATDRPQPFLEALLAPPF